MYIELNHQNYLYDKVRNALFPAESSHCGRVDVCILHPETESIAYSIENCAGQLILQVTQRCNLACKYCCYSKLYPQSRRPSSRDMDWNTAKKAIDMFAARSGHTVQPGVSFYGGEPLLNFALIRRCIDYIEDRYANRNIRYNITTNLTLTDDDMFAYLAAHRVNLNISLDGPQDVHDRARVFRNGRGSFQKVYSALLHIKECYPAYFRELSFTSVAVDPSAQRECEQFFFSDPLFEHRPVHSVSGLSNGYDEKVYQTLFGRSSDVQEDADYIAVQKLCYLFRAEEQITNRNTHHPQGDSYSRYFSGTNRVFSLFADGIKKNGITRGDIRVNLHHSGPCIAIEDRMFVNVDGDIFPCEKVNENCVDCRIGNVHNDSLNARKIEALLNLGRLNEEDCKKCDYIRFCEICAGSCSDDVHLTYACKRTECLRQQAAAERDINVAKYVYETLSKDGLL